MRWVTEGEPLLLSKAVSLSKSKSRLAFALMYAWMALLAAPFLARGPLRIPLGGVAPLAPPCSPRASSSGAAVVTCGAPVVIVWCWREGGLSDSLPLSPHPKAGTGVASSGRVSKSSSAADGAWAEEERGVRS